MPTYRSPDRPDIDLLAQVIQEYHPELNDVGCRVGLLYAHAKRSAATGLPTGPALMHHGYPAAAIVRINNLRDRVQGKPDATVEVDADRFIGDETWDEEEKIALLHHEVHHLIVVRDKHGEVKLDDANRPRLKLRQHDIVIGGFMEICEKHGIKALEAQQYRDIHQTFTQGLFPWA